MSYSGVKMIYVKVPTFLLCVYLMQCADCISFILRHSFFFFFKTLDTISNCQLN